MGCIYRSNTYINCNDCVNPVATQEDIVYTLVYTNEFGCISTDDISILLRKEDHYCYFPTAFTPNSDNVNDIYRSICKNVESVELRIYNRWGELIYSGNVADGLSGWDGIYNGKEQNIDVYTYYAKIKYLNGDTENTSGNFTLIR
ncbi:MAG: gliding motility-associated C-terminal domain-containing protein [Chitinophagales bacterium]